MPPKLVTGDGDDWGAEETTDSDYADDRHFYKVEKWTKDDMRPAELLFAGNRIEKARAIFDAAVKRRPGGRYYIRQGIRVLRKWPED